MRLVRSCLGVVALGLASAVLVAPPSASARTGSGGPAAPVATRAVTTVPLRVGTYNIKNSLPMTTFWKALGAFAPRVDVFGLQEINTEVRESALRRLTRSGWGSFVPHHQRAPILWRRSELALVSTRIPRVSRATSVGREMAVNHGRVRERRVSVVRLRHLATGQRLVILDVHLQAGACSSGDYVGSRPRTVRVYKHQMRRIGSITKHESKWGAVFVLGDFNCGWLSDSKNQRYRMPYATFARRGMQANWATSHPDGSGTRGKALLDQIYAPVRPRSTGVQGDIRFSDHLPAVATYALPLA